MVHIDARKYVRIERIGHRIHGDRRTRVQGAGWECTFVAVDDCARLAHAEMHTSSHTFRAVCEQHGIRQVFTRL